jgi:hypothetical protein
MSPARDAYSLVAVATGFHTGMLAEDDPFRRLWCRICLRGALRIIIAYGSRRVRAEAKELLGGL